MANIRVDTGALSRAAQALRRAGDDFGANADELSGGLRIVGSAAGDSGVLAAALDASERWGRSLARCGAGVCALGVGLESAAAAYEAVEAATSEGLGACHPGMPRP